MSTEAVIAAERSAFNAELLAGREDKVRAQLLAATDAQLAVQLRVLAKLFTNNHPNALLLETTAQRLEGKQR